jgi:hypothetical protein
MKNVYNMDSTKTISVIGADHQPISISPLSMKVVDDESAEKFKSDFKKAQVTDYSESQDEPWELKVLPSLPVEMRNKVKFQTPEKLVGAEIREVIEPPQPIDESGKLKPANIHVCPMGCGYSSSKLKAVRMHQLHCKPQAI